MRSASMALLGFDETRISLSRSDKLRILRSVRESSQRASEPLLEPGRRAQPRKAFLQEQADAAMDRRPGFAVGTETQMLAEILLSCGVEGPVEEKVRNAFHVVTAHQASATSLLDPEFLFFLFFRILDLQLGVLIIREEGFFLVVL